MRSSGGSSGSSGSSGPARVRATAPIDPAPSAVQTFRRRNVAGRDVAGRSVAVSRRRAVPADGGIAWPEGKTPGSDGARPSGGQVDIVGLATALVDATGERDIAKIRSLRLQPAVAAKTVPTAELEVAEVRQRTAERKVALLSALARAALEETESEVEYREFELKHIRARHDAGRVDASAMGAAQSRLGAARMRLEMLREVLKIAR